MTIKGQYRGHCQACGRVQVVNDPRLIAKHGYRVAGFGYFNGTCFGSGEQPLELNRTLTDDIIADMRQQAQRNEVRAMALRAGTLKPTRAQRLDSRGSRVWLWVGTGHNKGRDPVMVGWAEADDHERARQIEESAGDCESFARHARSHTASLTELADRVHNTPMIDRNAEELARVAKRKAKTQPIEGAYRSKAEQKRELEELNRKYSIQRKIISDRYLERAMWPGNTLNNDAYYAIPFDLHQWRAKTSKLVRDTLPELEHTVNAIEALQIHREEIKARPVIK